MMGHADLVGEYVGLWHEASNKLLAAGRVRATTFDVNGEPVLWLHVDSEDMARLWLRAMVPCLHSVYRWPVMGLAHGPLRIEIFHGGIPSQRAREGNL